MFCIQLRRLSSDMISAIVTSMTVCIPKPLRLNVVTFLWECNVVCSRIFRIGYPGWNYCQLRAVAAELLMNCPGAAASRDPSFEIQVTQTCSRSHQLPIVDSVQQPGTGHLI